MGVAGGYICGGEKESGGTIGGLVGEIGERGIDALGSRHADSGLLGARQIKCFIFENIPYSGLLC